MLVEQIYTENALRNFNYLIACPETGEALAIDPLDVEKCLAAAKDKGWEIRQILNTHEHGDHTGGNTGMIAATGAKLLAHHGAKEQNRISGVDIGLKAGDVVKIGKTVELEVLDTPGHTQCHVCLLSHTDQPSLFSGDTLFSAGAGNCKGGGHPEALYETFVEQLIRLPATTRVFPGHDYLANNLGFTLDREPDNKTAAEMLPKAKAQDPHHPIVTTMADEMRINTFFRLNSASVIAALRKKFSDFPEHPSEKDVFIALRELRNSW
ncbi:MAG TPA: hydroxyacylglutathione hydrolase [Alphaproteobacteria bacterium]|nr:hydroxyacylglutathione hydrolase [Alphaproteobacteria bacterium]